MRVSLALARDSRTLATASQRDSSSMKTLAAVTVIFLPGTFVATFLALPVFDWKGLQPGDSGDALISKWGFGIYWLITIPLTTLTIAA